MKKRTRASWIFCCALASTLAMGAVHAQEEEDSPQAGEGDAFDPAPPKISKPGATSKPKSILQKLGNAFDSLTGNKSSAERARENEPVDVSFELVEYLRRTVREHRSEIDRGKQKGNDAPATVAKPKPKKTNPSPYGRPTLNRKQFATLLSDLDKAEAELAQLKAVNGKKPPAAANPKIRKLLDTPYVGTVYVSSKKNVRFFVARLIIDNPTSKPVVIKRSELQLSADGKTYKSGAISTQVKNHSYSSANKSVSLGRLKLPAEVKIPAGGNGSIWVVFENLPLGNNIPKMTLNMKLAGRPSVLDINAYARSVMGLAVERVGPQGSLGLMTIGGSLNMINIGSLVDELDKLTADKVIRVVIRWKKSAPQSDSQIGSWIKQQAQQAGQNQRNNDNRFPIIPAAIRELHLAEVPSQNGGTTYYSSYGRNAPNRIHKTVEAAVSAALRTAFAVLSRDQLLHEIEEGHPLTRAAALAGGGGRLSSDDLPLVLKYAEGDAADMQRAALIALRHFGTSEALAALIKQAETGAEPMSAVAIESLAGSRYSAAHRALLKLLKGASPELKKKIVVIVARYPRPIWRDVVYEFATADDPQVSVVALQALVRIGHPQLVDVLEDSLHKGTRSFQEAAFKILASRTDSRSEDLAMQYTLDRMERSAPTSEMMQLLQRTRDRRAVPLLLAHFEKSKSSRSAIIDTLAQIGDQSVADMFLKQYASLSTNEKTIVLNMLRQFRSPKFRELAGEALLTKDSSLIRAACQGLQEDGSTKAIALLINGYEKSKSTTAWSYISNALSYLGTSEARAALQKATQTKDANRRNYAVNALRNIRQRSPGYQYIYQAQQFDRQKKWKESIEKYTIAAQMDPQLPEAFAGRGTALLHQNKFKEAGPDFEKAIKLDPFNSVSLTGLGIVRVLEGKADEGIKLIEGKRKMFENDVMFAYNAACVYGRALEAVKKDLKAADRDKKIAEYQKLALNDLQRSIKLGFRDKDWMKKDPDLKSLHDLDEFKKIHSPDATDGENKATNSASDKAEAAVQPAIAIPAIDFEAP